MYLLLVDTERQPIQCLDLGAACILTDTTLDGPRAAWQGCVQCSRWETDSDLQYTLTVLLSKDRETPVISLELRTRYAAFRCASCRQQPWSAADAEQCSAGVGGGEADDDPAEQLSPAHVHAMYKLQGNNEANNMDCISKEYDFVCPDCQHRVERLSSQQAVQQQILDHLSASEATGRPCHMLKGYHSTGMYADPAAYGSSNNGDVPYEIKQVLARLTALIGNYILHVTQAAPSAAASSSYELHPWRTWAIKALTQDVALIVHANYVRPSLQGLTLSGKPSLLYMVLAPPFIITEDNAGLAGGKLAVLLHRQDKRLQQQQQQQQQQLLVEQLDKSAPAVSASAAAAAGQAKVQTLLASLLELDPFFQHVPAAVRVQQFLDVLGTSIDEVAAAMLMPCITKDTMHHLKVCAECGRFARGSSRLGVSSRPPKCKYCIMCSSCAGCLQRNVAAGAEAAAAAAAAAAGGGGECAAAVDGCAGVAGSRVQGSPTSQKQTQLCFWCQDHQDVVEAGVMLGSNSSHHSSRSRHSSSSRRRSSSGRGGGGSGSNRHRAVRHREQQPPNSSYADEAAKLGLQLTAQQHQYFATSRCHRWCFVHPPPRPLPAGFVMIRRPRLTSKVADCYYIPPDATPVCRSDKDILRWQQQQQQQQPSMPGTATAPGDGSGGNSSSSNRGLGGGKSAKDKGARNKRGSRTAADRSRYIEQHQQQQTSPSQQEQQPQLNPQQPHLQHEPSQLHQQQLQQPGPVPQLAAAEQRQQGQVMDELGQRQQQQQQQGQQQQQRSRQEQSAATGQKRMRDTQLAQHNKNLKPSGELTTEPPECPGDTSSGQQQQQQQQQFLEQSGQSPRHVVQDKQQQQLQQQVIELHRRLNEQLEEALYDVECSADEAVQALAEHGTVRRVEELRKQFSTAAEAAAAAVHDDVSPAGVCSVAALEVLNVFMRELKLLQPDVQSQQLLLAALAQAVSQEQLSQAAAVVLQEEQHAGYLQDNTAGVLRLLLACWLRELWLLDCGVEDGQTARLRKPTTDSCWRDFVAGMCSLVLELILQGCRAAAALTPPVATTGAAERSSADVERLPKLATELVMGTALLLFRCADQEQQQQQVHVRLGRWRLLLQRCLSGGRVDLCDVTQKVSDRAEELRKWSEGLPGSGCVTSRLAG